MCVLIDSIDVYILLCLCFGLVCSFSLVYFLVYFLVCSLVCSLSLSWFGLVCSLSLVLVFALGFVLASLSWYSHFWLASLAQRIERHEAHHQEYEAANNPCKPAFN